ncbi:CUE domain protein, putative [Talaromyces stipitatus ATCC 10500]|uniref:CUE domain protein, putative n=1 Tax=Talaromyces stipitatus (strain ATCC 10500 / CBS 375.48 / QM 6759 / NRRL 1006) TaxID=441959 RepID=B8MIA3_TALSN|nr:CUE domain protein, putative [Talaromyces stipitatus ATCC 10500]EED14587.1 CUE domain protein, putative [Talaromyces stipitatus ATCC 10500]
MDLPRLIPVPPSVVRETIPNEEWEVTLDAWILLTELRLHLSAKQFEECAHIDGFNVTFLASYFAAHGDARLHASNTNRHLTTAMKAKHLRRSIFLLLRRYYLDVQLFPLADELLDWRFLSQFSDTYHSSSALKQLLLEVWARYENEITSSLEKGKAEVTEMLLKADNVKKLAAAPDIILDMRRLSVLSSALPYAGYLLMAGSDYLDSLHDAYRISFLASDEADGRALRNALVANVYVGLTSLLKIPNPNLSLFLDQLFSLKVSAGVDATSSKTSDLSPELLSDLVCSTDILVRIERNLVSSSQKRGQDLVDSLREYQHRMRSIHNQHYQRHKQIKGKGKMKAVADNGDGARVHKMSLITQIRDLFPDLGEGFVVRLLNYYADSVESIVAHLLEGSLPRELKILNRAEPLSDHNMQNHDVMEPHHTPPHVTSPQPTYTRNIDLGDDEIIQAARSAARVQAQGEAGGQKKKLFFGRANIDSTADSILADRSQHAANKAAILSALANFDSDDDERDDTYDLADVGDAEGEQERRSRISTGAVGDTDKDTAGLDMTLYRLWKSSPAQFARDSKTRRSHSRATLKHETGMTDEAIEGWAAMLQRDKKKQSRLETRLALEAGMGGAGGAAASQPELGSAAYRRPGAITVADEDESPEKNDGSSTGLNARSRGRGRDGTGRGGSGSGGPNRGRGGNRGRGANHRRRDQHAKKMVRAGVLPS